MFRKTLTDFIEQQKTKMHDEKRKLGLLDEKGDDGGMLNPPNNPKLRVCTQPYLGLGEYEQRRQILLQERKDDYQQYIDKIKHPTIHKSNFFRNSVPECKKCCDKVVQTDIQGINSKLVQYGNSSKIYVERELPAGTGNPQAPPGLRRRPDMDRLPVDGCAAPRLGKLSPREKLMADLKGSHFTSLLSEGSRAKPSQLEARADKIQRQEKYLAELRHQIEEKQRILAMQRAQEQREEEFEIHRIEAQLKESQLEERRASADRYFSKNLEMSPRDGYKPRRFTSMSNISLDNHAYRSQVLDGGGSSLSGRYDYADPKFSRYSYQNTQPLIRHEKKPYSFNIPSTSVFYNTSPRRKGDSYAGAAGCCSLNSPKKLASKYDDSLPVPVLKTRSPVAKDLKHSVVVQSRSPASRRLEDKWQIPAVRRNIISSNPAVDGDSQSILTQLGAIRLQLQQEQLRLDETLRNRGSTQTSVI